MGQTVGKQVEWKYPKPLIFDKIDLSKERKVDFHSDPMEFIAQRFEMKEKIDHWAFKWSHWIIEEVFVWPEYDVKQLLYLLNEVELGDAIPQNKVKKLISD